MKHTHIILACLLAAVLSLVLFTRDRGEDGSARPAVAVPSPEPSLSAAPSTDHIQVREAPIAMPSLTKSQMSDPGSTAALIKILSRHPEETLRLEEENQWIRRRELVEVDQSFRDIGKKVLAGEDIAEFEVPLFDGETATVLFDQEKSEIYSETSGTLFGDVKGEEGSFVVLTYYNDSDSGFIDFAGRELTVQYEGFGDRKVVVKDFDEQAQAKAMPCPHCRKEGTAANHASHSASPPTDPAGAVATE